MKLYAVLFLASLVLVAAEDCTCDEDATQKEIKELWDFLAPMEVAHEKFHSIPGELSPLAAGCSNCIEKNRKKREQQAEELKREERSPKTFRVWRHTSDERNKCPIGYRRLAIVCVKVR